MELFNINQGKEMLRQTQIDRVEIKNKIEPHNLNQKKKNSWESKEGLESKKQFIMDLFPIHVLK